MVKILIIDDSEVIRNLLTEYLSDLGYQVDSAFDGQDGIEKALSGDYGLVLCDIHMPRKNGFEVLRAVTATKPDMMFVMTDSLPDKLSELAQQAGAYCCLKKPFDLTEVKTVVKKLLSEIRAYE
ncbi:MAG: response regulator [Candidatus Zixiibacteriota bacterium]